MHRYHSESNFDENSKCASISHSHAIILRTKDGWQLNAWNRCFSSQWTITNHERPRKTNGDSLEVCTELCSIVLFQLSFKQGKKLMNGLVRIEENLIVQKTRRSKAY
jgi:hypothetical protein